MRLWTARLFCDAAQVTRCRGTALARRAAIEPDVEVRSQLACSAKRLPARDALPIVRALLAHERGCRDIHIPLLLWWAIEAKVATDPEAVLAIFRGPRDLEPADREGNDHGAADAPVRRGRDQAGPDALRPAAGPGARARARQAPDGGLRGGLRRPVAGRACRRSWPMRWPGTAASRSRSACARASPRRSAEALRMLADEHGDRAKQLQFLQILGEVRRPAAVPVCCAWLPFARQRPAVRRLGVPWPTTTTRPSPRGDQGLCQHVRRRAGRRPEPAGRSRELGRADSSRPSRRGRSTAHSVPREIVEKLLLLGDPAINTIAVTHLLGTVKPATSAELHARIARLAAVVRDGSGVPKPGKQIFDQQCARCHTLFGKGGKVGPDLTTYRRDDLETMLLNIVNPSAEIREGFAGSIVATTDGRILTGVIVEQDKNVVVLRDSDGHDATLARDVDRRDAARRKVAHARRPARQSHRPASPRPVRLPPKHAAAD